MDNLEKRTRIITPEGWSDNQRGDFFEQLIADVMRIQRYKVIQRIRFTGMEIDLLAENVDTRLKAYVECKFHKDNLASHIVYTLIGKANSNQVPLAYLYSTALLSKDAAGVVEERKGNPSLQPALAFVGPDELTDMFMQVFQIPPPDLAAFGVPSQRAGCLTLVIRPTADRFWVLEEKIEGVPSKARVLSISDQPEATIEQLKADFSRAGLWQGLEIIDAAKSDKSHRPNRDSSLGVEEEVVTTVSMAERYDDYRPCRPEDFVGRADLQKTVWDFLSEVSDGHSATRIISFVGPSGFGKSSVILKLADRFRNVKWRNRFYLFPVDVRSAMGPLFVVKAVRLAFQKAVDDGFISPDCTNIEIDSSESLLSSASVQSALRTLQAENRVLVIFFDQFEELFAKESLLHTFEQFQRLAYEVDSLGANLVLGFSWRTGITFSEDHPAYFLWQNLRDKRLEFKISLFDSRESNLLINQFETHTRHSLGQQLRRRLLEQCQGFPWLLKKLCIHVFDELLKGAGPAELLSRALNIKRLFDEDLEPLSREQNLCLRYIAEHSPVDMIDIVDVHGQDVLNQLATNRLVIRAGQKYAVYWDIFREYLLNGTVPAIPLTYMPTTNVSMILRAIKVLQAVDSMEPAVLAERLGYAEKTVVNILADLQAFLIATRTGTTSYSLASELKQSDSQKIAEFLSSQLKEHILVHKALDYVEPTSKLTLEDFKPIFSSAYPAGAYRAETVDAYLNRVLQWLTFAGLAEVDHEGISIFPLADGKGKGTLRAPGRKIGSSGGQSKALFLCNSGPKQAVEFATQLYNRKKVPVEDAESWGYRNCAYDLLRLGLANSNGRELVASTELLNLPDVGKLSDSVSELIKVRAMKSPFLMTMVAALQNDSEATVMALAEVVCNALGLNTWSEPTAKRYVTAAKTWLKYFERPQVDQLAIPLSMN